MIESVNRHLDACSKAFRRHLSPSSSSPANVSPEHAAVSHNVTHKAPSYVGYSSTNAIERKSSWSCSSAVRRTLKLVRTKSDNDRTGFKNHKNTTAGGSPSPSIRKAEKIESMEYREDGGSDRLNVPSSRKHHRSRSWDASCWANRRPRSFRMPLTQRLMSVGAYRANRSSTSSPNRSGQLECVHCEYAQLWNEKKKHEEEQRAILTLGGSYLAPAVPPPRPEIVVSSTYGERSYDETESSTSSSSYSSSDGELDSSEYESADGRSARPPRSRISSRPGSRKSKPRVSRDSFSSRSPTPPSSDHSPPLASRLYSFASTLTTSGSCSRTPSTSDAESSDSTIPIIPSISVTEFFDSDRSVDLNLNYHARHSLSDPDSSDKDRSRSHSIVTMAPSETETVTPWSPSDGEEDEGGSPTDDISPPAPICPPRPTELCNDPSDYLNAEVTPHMRSSSVDIPSLRLCIEKSDDEADDSRTLRSRSVDLAAVAERVASQRSPVASGKGFTTMLRKAITRSPLPSLARTNAQLDLFANLNKERAARYWAFQETATAGEHIWIGTGASTECYIGEMDCSKTGEKVKCAACHVVVHDGCLPLLRRMNFNCKLAYREAQTKFQKEQQFIVHHHWVHKWRQEGRCKACGKSFQSKFLNRELVSIACSWCKTAFHNKHGCFTMKQIEEPCSMGPLKDVIIPTSWVFKLPPRRISTMRKRHFGNNFSSKRKKRSTKKVANDRLFVVKPQPPLESSPRCPVLVFVNPKSGGNKGAKILHTLQWLVNPRQVFDVVAMNGPKYGLEMYRKLLPRLRVLVCGGDGTVGWVLSTLDALKWPVYPAIGIVPLGTGNDLARTLGWGATYADEPMSELLMAMAEETVVSQLDRWSLEVIPNPDADFDGDPDDGTVQDLPLSVMNNYFSIGADAHVALQFHESRSANPDVFNSRLKNRLFYGGIGTMDLFKRTWKDLSEHISLICDGVDLTWKIQELKLHCLLFLNIPRYAGGTLPWGAVQPAVAAGGCATTTGAASTTAANTTAAGSGQQQQPATTPTAAPKSEGQPSSPTHSPQFSPPSFCDGKVEVLGFTSATLAALQVGGRGERIAQCSEVKIITRKGIPAQVDGEPCKLAPSTITMRFHSKVPMLQRISVKQTSNSRRGSIRIHSMNAADPQNNCGTTALHTSVLLRLPVAVVSKEDYDAQKQEAARVRAAAAYLGDITVESETDLDQVRGIVQRLLAERREYFTTQNFYEWSFLDYISNDNVFRLNQSQESFQSVSDICQIDHALLIMHPGFRKPPSLTVNGGGGGDVGVGDASTVHKTSTASICSLDPRLSQMPEAMRIMFTSEEGETRI